MSWTEINVAGIRFEVPAGMTPSDEQGIDSVFHAWTGHGMTVTVDAGPFSDSLTRYTDRPDYSTRETDVGGRSARIVSYREPNGSRVTAVRLDDGPPGAPRGPGPLTLSITSDPDVPPDVVTRIADSIRIG